MKRFFTLGILLILFLFVLIGCGSYSFEQKDIETTVIKCERGEFRPNTLYFVMSYLYYIQKDESMGNSYKDLAYEKGSYDYNITIEIDNTNYIITRSKQYEVGQIITVKEIKYYSGIRLINKKYQ